MTMINFLDAVKKNNSEAAFGLLSEAAKATPEVFAGGVIPIDGFSFETLVTTELPSGSSYRKYGEGVSFSKAVRELREVKCHVLNRMWYVDKAIADGVKDGGASLMADEAMDEMEKAFQDMGSQFYYGSTEGGSEDGHDGLVQGVASTMEVDAGGTTADTGSSVWAVRFDRRGVSWIGGKSMSFEPGEIKEERLSVNSKTLTALVQEILARPGLMLRTQDAFGRIKKLTEDSGKGLTDDLISDLLAKFKVGSAPNAIFMTRRSLKQLQKSRTATNEKGAPAPFPTTIKGVDGQDIPIYVTESLLNTEALS